MEISELFLLTLYHDIKGAVDKEASVTKCKAAIVPISLLESQASQTLTSSQNFAVHT